MEDHNDPRPVQPSGSDLIFLSFFPIGVLSERAQSEDLRELRFADRRRELMIHASGRLGLPIPTDADVLLGLLHETVTLGYPEKVPFSRYQLLPRIGWQRNTERYERFDLALKRLTGTTYFTRNYYPDEQGRMKVEQDGSHLLEEFHHVTAADDKRDPGPSWIRWGGAIQRLFQRRYLKELDLERYLQFKSVVTKALYRYLDTRRLDGKIVVSERLPIVAYERIGLSRDYYPSQVKRKLDLSHEELRAAGFLTNVWYERTADGQGEKVVWTLTSRKEVATPKPAVRTSRPRPEKSGEETGAAARAAFEAWWCSLSEAEQDQLTEQARAELIGENATLVTYYRRNPDRLFEALRPILQRRCP